MDSEAEVIPQRSYKRNRYQHRLPECAPAPSVPEEQPEAKTEAKPPEKPIEKAAAPVTKAAVIRKTRESSYNIMTPSTSPNRTPYA